LNYYERKYGGFVNYTAIKMINTDTENRPAIISAVEEILETGQLWVHYDNEDYYIPELIADLKTLQQLNAISN